jgi:hypothetical protein
MKKHSKDSHSLIQRRRERRGLPVRLATILSEEEGEMVKVAAHKKRKSISAYIADNVLEALDKDLTKEERDHITQKLKSRRS